MTYKKILNLNRRFSVFFIPVFFKCEIFFIHLVLNIRFLSFLVL